MTNADFYSYIVDIASKVFGEEIFKRRELMDEVERHLREEGRWPKYYDELSGSRGKKSKGLARIDYAFIPLRKDGRLVRHSRDQWSVSENGPDLDQEFLEGGKVAYSHLKIERDPDAIRLKKMAAQKKNFGSLECEVCEFDFFDKYGKLGKGFAECHHLKPLSTLEGNPEKTKPESLIVICSNCHRIVHRGLRQGLELSTLEQIRAALLK